MSSNPPFLNVMSFVAQETEAEPAETLPRPNSLFLTRYESEDEGMVDPETEEYVSVLNELYDEEFNEAISALVDEARAIYETQFPQEQEDPRAVAYQAERLLTQHFAPLAAEADRLFGGLAGELGQRDLGTLSEDEAEDLVDGYQPSTTLSPTFEQFWGSLKRLAKGAISLAKRGISAVADVTIVPILNKLKALIPVLLKQVVNWGIGKLPLQLQPIARKLAEKIPFFKELEGSEETEAEAPATFEIGEIQNEFNQQLANLLFARSEVEQDLEVARAVSQQGGADSYPRAELDQARDRFVESLLRLREGEDPAPHLENFLPALLPVLKLGLHLAGRKRVVNFLAGLLAKLIQKFIGPQYAPALSQAIVDAGLRLIHLETTNEDEARAAASAVAATVEDTVRRVAALPEYVLDNQELLEGFALEAFEQAAAANLPPVLPPDAYRRRPDLGEAVSRHGVWIMMPRGRRKCYKKYSRKIRARISPYKTEALETLEGAPVGEFLEEQLGMAPGEEVDAVLHLYEAIPGTTLSHIAWHEEKIPKLDGAAGYEQLHPFTQEAAALLLGDPEMGRDPDPAHSGGPNNPEVGQRFYYLEIPGKSLLAVPGPAGRPRMRHASRFRLIFDFRRHEIRIFLYMSEVRSQAIAVKLRQHAHYGVLTARFRKIIHRGLGEALTGRRRWVKFIHGAVTPGHWAGALQRLPSLVPQVLKTQLTEWAVKAVAAYLKQHTDEFIKAADDTADGVSMIITLQNPPGFADLRDALKGKTVSLASLRVPKGDPADVRVRVYPGYRHG